MRSSYTALAGLLFLLAACGQPVVAPGHQAARPVSAMVTDDDIDRAVVAEPVLRMELQGTEAPDLHGLQQSHDSESLMGPNADLETHVVLPGAYGTIAFVRHNPDLAANPWMIYLMDQVGDAITLVYGGRREIDSVAVTEDGGTVLAAMRRTLDDSGDFEVYRITLATSAIERLTTTSHDERNVSMSADGGVLVWEGRNATGAPAVVIREGPTESTLAVAQGQSQPSVSGNGRYIALIRTLHSGNHRVVRYDRVDGSYQVLWGQEQPVTLSHPSSSDDGSKIAFLEYRPEGTAPTERQLVRYLDTNEGTFTNAVGAQISFFGPRIAHPHLARDGNHVVYAWRQANAWNLFTRRISTMTTQRIAVSAAPTNNLAPYWQKPAISPLPTVLYDLSHDSHHYLDPSDPNNTGDAVSFGAWRDLLVANGLQVEKLVSGPVTLSTLQSYGVFVTATPRSDFTASEIAAIGDYVEAGGSVLFIGQAGATHPAVNERLNAVVGQFGMELDGSPPWHSGYTEHLMRLHPINTDSDAYDPSGAARVVGGNWVFTSSDHVRLMATTSAGAGCVALIGSAAVWASNLDGEDNGPLAVRTLQYLLDCPDVTHPRYRLDIDVDGNGTGTVTVWPGDIECGATCSLTYESHLIVELDAGADSGSVFSGWSSFCSGTLSCPISMIADRAVTATFTYVGPTYTVSGNVGRLGSSAGAAAVAGSAAEPPAASAGMASGSGVRLVDRPPAEATATEIRTEPAWDPSDWSTAIPGVHYAPHQVIVGFRDNVASVDMAAAGELSEGQVAALNAALKATAAAFASDHGLSVLGTSPILGVALMGHATDLTLVEAMQRLANDPRVAYVEPNALLHAQGGSLTNPSTGAAQLDVEPQASHPTDPLYRDQRWHYGLVGAQRGWDTQRGSAAVRVAVLDTGYRSDHPDAPTVVAPIGEQKEFVSDTHVYPLCAGGTVTRFWGWSGFGSNAMDWMQFNWNFDRTCLTGPQAAGSHGAHVIGTIAAAWNDVGGVGLNRDVTIIPIRVLDVAGVGTTYEIAQGVLYAGGLPADDGQGGTWSMQRADIANMSLGGSAPSTTGHNAIQAASSNGTLVIAAAGNSSSNAPMYPAGYSEVVAVTAIDWSGNLAWYSNYGSWVELTAPGSAVVSTAYDYRNCPMDGLCTTANGGVATYALMSGTSMAAPHAAGVAALYKAHNPNLTREQLRNALVANAIDWGAPGFDPSFGHGLVHVRPGVGVALVNDDASIFVRLIDATTGAVRATQLADSAGDYAFHEVPDGTYFVLATTVSHPTAVGATGSAIAAHSTAGPLGSAEFQRATPVSVAGADRNGIDLHLGWPGVQPSNNATPASAAFMHPGHYAAITYSHTVPDRWFRVRVAAPADFRIWTDGFNSPDLCQTVFGDLDTVIELYEADGTTLVGASDDGFGRGLCSDLKRNLSAGTYLVKVRAAGAITSTNNGRRTILRFDLD